MIGSENTVVVGRVVAGHVAAYEGDQRRAVRGTVDRDPLLHQARREAGVVGPKVAIARADRGPRARCGPVYQTPRC
jgi:hypothetical protein